LAHHIDTLHTVTKLALLPTAFAAGKVEQSVAIVRLSIRPFVFTQSFVRVWVMTAARLGLKVRVIGQGQGLRTKVTVEY